MTKYKILPHFRFDGRNLVFLDRETVVISERQKRVLSDISLEKELDVIDEIIVQQLIERGILLQPSDTSHVQNPQNLVVAAHSDDAALSLGGRLILDGPNFKILNVFSTCPKSFMFKGYGLTPDEVTYFNNLEESFYARLVGAGLSFLGYREATERGYKTPFVNHRGQESGLVDRIQGDIMQYFPGNHSAIFFPLSIGNHIDHLILYEIGRRIAQKFENVFFYEDQPYTEEISQDELKRHVEEKTKGMKIAGVVDITRVIERKIDLAAVYKTQYDREYLKRLADYAFRIGDGMAIERVWGTQNAD